MQVHVCRHCLDWWIGNSAIKEASGSTAIEYTAHISTSTEFELS